MVVISYPIIRSFIRKHPKASDVMTNWLRFARMADLKNFHEVKRLFANSVDAIGNDRYVFNIGGGNYRIVAMIFFDVRTIYIRFVGTHAQYDRLKNADSI